MYIIWIMLFFTALYIIRAVRGPSVWDRLLGLNLISTKIAIIIVILASLNETTYLIDFAIVYVLLAFISTFFIVRFLVWKIKGGKI